MLNANKIRFTRPSGTGRSATRARLAAPALALLGFMTAGAHAAQISYSYSGTVGSGTDPSGLFGGGDLTGAAITFSAYYDPAAYSSQQLNQGGGTYDFFQHDTAGSSYVSVTVTTLSNQQYTRTLTSGGAYIGNDFLRSFASGSSGIGVYGVMTGFGSTEATLQPQLGGTAGSWVSGSTIFNPPGTATSLFLVASRDATDGSLTDNISITGFTQNTATPEPASLSILAAGTTALTWARRRRRTGRRTA